MAGFLRVAGYLSLLLTVAATVAMLLTFRRPRPVRRLPLLIAIGVSLALLPLYMLLSGARLNPVLGVPVLAVGLILGLLSGSTTRLYGQAGQVMGKHSLWFLLGWGGTWALSQGLNLLGSTLLASLGLLPVFFSTGMHVGSSANLLARRLFFRPAPPPQPMPSPRPLPHAVQRARAQALQRQHEAQSTRRRLR